MPVVGDEHVEVHPIFVAADLVKVGRHLPEVRHRRGPRDAVLIAAREREHLVTPLLDLFEPTELLLKRRQLRGGVGDRRAVGGEHRERREALQIAGRGGHCVEPLAEAVVPLAVVPGVEHGAVEHEVAGECQPAPLAAERATPEQVAHRAGAVAGRFRAPEFAATPRERVHLVEGPVDGDRRDRRPHVARAVDRELVGELRHECPEGERLLEQIPFIGRHGHLHAAGGRMAGELGVPLALLAVVVRVEHPLDLFDPKFGQGVEHAAVAQVDQDGRGAVLDHIDVAGVGPTEDVRVDFLERHELAPPGRECSWLGHRASKATGGGSVRATVCIALRARAFSTGMPRGVRPPAAGRSLRAAKPRRPGRVR